VRTVASTETTHTELKRAGGVGTVRNYLGAPGSLEAGPQAFLVERPYPNPRVAPHFHDIDQFQVIAAGDGRMGKKEVKPFTFQYADAFTPYGPIVGRDNGISFFTLRAVASGGYFAMPGSRHHMPGRAGRNIAATFDIERDPLPAHEVIREPLMEPEADGVYAAGLRLGAHARTAGVTPDAGCQYYLVCTGSLIQDGKPLPANSLIHVDAGEDTLQLQAGPEGANVLVMQFPRPSDRPGSDPAKLANRSMDDYHKVPANPKGSN
jgi:hypothetical protein